jgi:hypothetical protein
VLSEEVTRRAEKCGARLYAALAYMRRSLIINVIDPKTKYQRSFYKEAENN